MILTFRPDKYLEPGQAQIGMPTLIEAGGSVRRRHWPLCGFIAALENRRQYFKDAGQSPPTTSHFDARTDSLESSEAERIFDAGS